MGREKKEKIVPEVEFTLVHSEDIEKLIKIRNELFAEAGIPIPNVSDTGERKKGSAPRKKKKWTRFRHRVYTFFGRPVLALLCRTMYGLRVTRFKEQGKRQYLVLMNHQTAFDQFFIAVAFRGPVYYLASEDLFSKGFVSSLIRHLVAPIPIRKSMTDIKAVLDCKRVAREGGTIALAPEGNRTYSGRTEHIKPSIASFVRSLKLPVAIFKIEGGYGVHPRWSDVRRKGPMKAGVSRVIEYEEYKNLTDDELFRLISDELYVNEAKADGFYYHKRSAEYLERCMYVCPFCGLSEFETNGDKITCKKCARTVRYLPSKELQGEGFDFPFRFIADWYDYQSDFVRALDLTPYADTPVYSDTIRFSETVVYSHKELIAEEATLSVYADRFTVRFGEQTLTYPFATITAASALGRNKLNLYIDGRIFQVHGDKRFCVLKYLNLYYHAVSEKSAAEGEKHAEFLGL